MSDVELNILYHVYGSALLDTPLFRGPGDVADQVRADSDGLLVRSLEVMVKDLVPSHKYAKLDLSDDGLVRRVRSICCGSQSTRQKIERLADLGVLAPRANKHFGDALKRLLPPPKPATPPPAPLTVEVDREEPVPAPLPAPKAAHEAAPAAEEPAPAEPAEATPAPASPPAKRRRASAGPARSKKQKK